MGPGRLDASVVLPSPRSRAAVNPARKRICYTTPLTREAYLFCKEKGFEP